MSIYSDLIKASIEKAYAEKKQKEEKTTVITEHENGIKSIMHFYKKNGAIWCHTETGCITDDYRVYKVKTEKPYIRDHGLYWYLGKEEKKAMSYLL